MGRTRAGRIPAPATTASPTRKPDTAPNWTPTPAIMPETGGQPLDAATQADMGGRFGHNFAAVRVHADTRAAESAAALDARAFAVGHDIAFGAGQYAPETGGGQRLLAHELTHVVQHDRAPLVPDMGMSFPGDAAEREARATADAVATGAPLPAIAAAPVAAVQRDPNDPATATATPPPAATPGGAPPAGQPASPNGPQTAQPSGTPSLEYFNYNGVVTAKDATVRRGDALTQYATAAQKAGDTTRQQLGAYSATYAAAYKDYASAIRAARQEAGTENLFLGIAIGVAINVAAAFILPATAAGWFALTAAEAGTALFSGGVQAGAGALLGSVLQISGGDLEPGGLTPEAQQLGLWKTAASLYKTGGAQADTIQKLGQVARGAEFLAGEIRVHAAAGETTLTEDQVFAQMKALVLADQQMAADETALKQGQTELATFMQNLATLNTEGNTQHQMEQNIWIMWMDTMPDSSVLDRDPIEDRLHAIKVLGPDSRLGVDFGIYTFFWDEWRAKYAAQAEAGILREKAAAAAAPAQPGGK